MANNLNFLQSVREEDFVEYYVYPSLHVCEDPETERVMLERILKQINSIIEEYVNKYLWHRDNFKLIPRTRDYADADNDNYNNVPHLYGVSHYGDNIEDEWFIVFLLFHITKLMNSLTVRIVDSDGEFLLIEAANYLPQWARPEICEKRVYIYQGNLHIITPKNEDNEITVTKMLQQIYQKPEASIASADIQNSILNKIKGYPERIGDNLHSVTLYLPLGVATILKHKPNLVAPATLAFCDRDLIDMKACRAMKYFPPESRVYTRVTFTKCLYAMIMHSKYIPDKRIGWNIPALNSLQYKSHSLGIKLASGFEILASQAKPGIDLESNKGWQVYLQKLKNRDYFRDLLEHSHDYKDLLNKAKEYYINYKDSMQSTARVGQEILNLIRNLDCNSEEFKHEENIPDDDDSWLNVDPKELDKMLEEHYGKKSFVPINGNTDAASFTEKISKFLDHVSDVQGVEFPNDLEKSPLRPPRGVKCKGKNKVSFSEGTKLEEKSNSTKVNFDPAAFTCALQNILDFMIPDDDNWDLDSDSDMSAYGEDPEVNVENDEKVDNKMTMYMAEMDKQLAKTTIGQSFEKVETFEDVESFQPVDIDVNTLKNILVSYQSQLGEAGPASNMLGPMGVHLEPGTSHGKH